MRNIDNQNKLDRDVNECNEYNEKYGKHLSYVFTIILYQFCRIVIIDFVALKYKKAIISQSQLRNDSPAYYFMLSLICFLLRCERISSHSCSNQRFAL